LKSESVIIALAARTYIAKKKPAVIYDGRLFFGTQRISAAVTPRNAY
jgi:hypothetical protein